MEIRVKKHIRVPKSIEGIKDIFKNRGFKLFLVGGAVRDSLMGIYPKDFDLATDATPDKVKELLPMYDTIESGEQFAIVNVVTEDGTFEVATFREDIGKGRRPDDVKFSTIDKDVLRRDLTINALFYDLDTGEIVDLVGGIEDLENGVVRTVGNAEDRFDEDKLRIMRSMRFAARVGSDVDEGIDKAIKNDNSIISGDGKPLAQERIQDEFVKGIKQAKSVVHFLNLLEKYDLFKWVFGDLNTDGPKVESKNILIVLSTLLVNNDNIDKILVDKLKFNKSLGKQVKFLIDFSKEFSLDTVYKFKTRIKTLDIKDNILSEFGVIMGLNKTLIKNFNKYEITTKGEDLIKLGFKGKSLGVEKERIETEKFKFIMDKKRISYTAVVLDKESHIKLVDLLKELFGDLTDWKVFAHHMTIKMGGLPSERKSLLGQEIDLAIDGFGYTDDVVAVRVDTNLQTKNETPHITLAVGPKGKPVMSNLITNWEYLQPFHVYGTVEEIPF